MANLKPTWPDCPNQCEPDGTIRKTGVRCVACGGFPGVSRAESDGDYSDRIFKLMSEILTDQTKGSL